MPSINPPTTCPRCQHTLTFDPKRVGFIVCSNEEHQLIYNTNNHLWFLRTFYHNTYCYVGFDGKYFTMSVKGPGSTPVINTIDPFKLEDANDMLNRYLKLLALL